MKIKCGKYTICSDLCCYWIEETYTNSNGKESTKKVAGYVSRLDDLVNSFVEMKTRSSDATTLKEMLKEMQKIQQEAKEIVSAIKEIE